MASNPLCFHQQTIPPGAEMAEIDVDDLMRDLKSTLETAYRRGFRAGGEAMRQSILRAAASPEGAASTMTPTSNRAPRGAVGDFLADLLTKHPGLTMSEIEVRGAVEAPELATKSLGNDLRRREGTRYRRDRPGGNRWFLIDDAADQERAPTNEGGDNAPA